MKERERGKDSGKGWPTVIGNARILVAIRRG
jgi:hypothetical protein